MCEGGGAMISLGPFLKGIGRLEGTLRGGAPVALAHCKENLAFPLPDHVTPLCPKKACYGNEKGIRIRLYIYICRGWCTH